MIFAPLEGCQRVEVIDRQERIDTALLDQDIVEVHFLSTKRIMPRSQTISTPMQQPRYMKPLNLLR
jgi:hypothetical protein